MSLRRLLFLSLAIAACLSGYAWNPVDSISADTILLEDGTLYMGQFDSLFNGTGRCIYADGTVYDGGWENGLWEGSGTVVYPDGDIYRGEFHNNAKEGKGTYTYHTGARYEGEWKNDRFNGKGLLIFADGGRYNGAWKDDMKHGYGQLISYDGQLTSGYFYHDEYLGLPSDTEILQDSTLTPELIEWGFHKENHEIPGMTVALSYSREDIMACSFWFDMMENAYFGFSVGRNMNPPIKGKEGFFSLGAISQDIHMTGVYVHSLFTFDAGIKWKSFSLAGGAGVCFKTSYQNCKANSDARYYTGVFINQGESYYVKAPDDITFAYRAFLRYHLEVDKKPKVSLYLGYGNAESLFVGVGLNL